MTWLRLRSLPIFVDAGREHRQTITGTLIGMRAPPMIRQYPTACLLGTNCSGMKLCMDFSLA